VPENSRSGDPEPGPCATLSSLTLHALLHSVEGVAGPLHTCRQANKTIYINKLDICETSFTKSGRCSPAGATSAYSPVKQGFINWHNDCKKQYAKMWPESGFLSDLPCQGANNNNVGGTAFD
jgi:hypothetical protein